MTTHTTEDTTMTTNATNESLVGGGRLVRVHGASGLAVEGVPGARRGLLVTSSIRHTDGEHSVSGQYRITVRAVSGTDLWRVRRARAVVVK